MRIAIVGLVACLLLFAWCGACVSETAACDHYSGQYGNLCDSYLRDSSDWWSRIPDRAATAEPKVTFVKPSAQSGNFRILGLSVWGYSIHWPQAIIHTLGRATVIERGDASVGRAQVCYKSAKASERTTLIFEQGECAESFYLFEDGKPFVGSDRCVPSASVTGQLRTPTGLGIRLTRAEVLRILGRPSGSKGDSLIYEYTVKLKRTKEQIEALRQGYPEFTPEPEYGETLDILIRFRNGRSWYMYVASFTC
jgi:hypothetical protein